jgi:hypothetical protein
MCRAGLSTPVAIGMALLALAIPRAGATVLVPADLAELVAGARTIVHGRVVSTETQWLEERRGIETIVTLEVEDALKGGASGSVAFRVPGGEMGRYRSVVPGAPVFTAGEDVIVFLAGDGPSIPHVLGFSQGVYRVRQGAGGRVVRPGVPGPASESTPMRRGTTRSAAPLGSFETEVRALVAAGGAR